MTNNDNAPTTEPEVGPDGLTEAERAEKAEQAAQEFMANVSVFPVPYRGAGMILVLAYNKYVISRTSEKMMMYFVYLMQAWSFFMIAMNVYMPISVAMYAWNDLSGFLTLGVQVLLAIGIAIASLMKFYDTPWQDPRPGGGMIQPMSIVNLKRWISVCFSDAAVAYGFYTIYTSLVASPAYFVLMLVAWCFLSIGLFKLQMWWITRGIKVNADANKILMVGAPIKIIDSSDTFHNPLAAWGNQTGVVTKMDFDPPSKQFLYEVQLDPGNPFGLILANVVRTDVEPLDPETKLDPPADESRVKVRAKIQFCGG